MPSRGQGWSPGKCSGPVPYRTILEARIGEWGRVGIRDRTPKVTHRLLLSAGSFCCHLLGNFFQYGHRGDSWLGKQRCRPGDQEAGRHQYRSHKELPRTLHLPDPDIPSLPGRRPQLDVGPNYTRPPYRPSPNLPTSRPAPLTTVSFLSPQMG